MNLPSWKLPPGVSRGTWDYLNSLSIAADYDRYFAGHSLMKLDIDFVCARLPELSDTDAPLVADLGCGTGRVSRALSPLGYRMLNVDLSKHMLEELRRQCLYPDKNEYLQANLVELAQHLQPASIDLAVCLFSSIGMIRGFSNRVKFLKALPGALKPGASLILHAHNRYHSLWDPQGPAWLLKTLFNSWYDREWEYGDRIYNYRGLPAMFLHIFSRRELSIALKAAGFEQLEFFPINVCGDQLLRNVRFSNFRAGGFFVVAKTADLRR